MFFVVTLVPKGLQRSLNTQKNWLVDCPPTYTGALNLKLQEKLRKNLKYFKNQKILKIMISKLKM